MDSEKGLDLWPDEHDKSAPTYPHARSGVLARRCHEADDTRPQVDASAPNPNFARAPARIHSGRYITPDIRTTESAMKRTDIERRERELRRAQKKAAALERGEEAPDELGSVGDCIKALVNAFEYNDLMILNIVDNMELLELLADVKDAFPDDFDKITQKAVRKTKVVYREESAAALKELASALD